MYVTVRHAYQDPQFLFLSANNNIFLYMLHAPRNMLRFAPEHALIHLANGISLSDSINIIYDRQQSTVNARVQKNVRYAVTMRLKCYL